MKAKGFYLVVELHDGTIRRYRSTTRQAAEKRLTRHQAAVADLGTGVLYRARLYQRRRNAMKTREESRGRGYVGRVCTLDGHQATIVGRLNDFATVATTDGSVLVAEFAWPTVGRVMDAGGEFALADRPAPRSLAASIRRVERFAETERLSTSFAADLVAVIAAAKRDGGTR